MEDFSSIQNDRKAAAIAARIVYRLPVNSPPVESEEFLQWIIEKGSIPRPSAVKILRELGDLPPTRYSAARIAYALLHNTGEITPPKRYTQAHAHILEVTKQTKHKNTNINLRLLLTSSTRAGQEKYYTAPIKEAVILHKNIYSGRSMKYRGRSLLEFVGCVCTVKFRDNLITSITADKAEKKLNKELCMDRATADGACNKAPSCVRCNKRRKECRLAIHI